MQVLDLTKSDIKVLNKGKCFWYPHFRCSQTVSSGWTSEHFAMPKQWVFCCLRKMYICRFMDACICNPFTMSLHPPLPSVIFYNGHAHWVTTFSDGNEIFLFDSLTRDDLPSTLEEQITAVYASFCSNGGLLTVTKVGVQQQKGYDRLWAVCDCLCLSLCTRWWCCKAWIWLINYATTASGLLPVRGA